VGGGGDLWVLGGLVSLFMSSGFIFFAVSLHAKLSKSTRFFQFEAKCETLTFSPVSNENEYERRTLSYTALEVKGE
jgi:hypothetical protein